MSGRSLPPLEDHSLRRRWRRYRWPLLAVIPVAALVAFLVWRHALPEYDLIIEGGRIFDGEKMLGFGKAVGIREGRIAKVGFLYGAKARERIRAEKRVIAPGFIDTHVHIESSMGLIQPLRAPNFVQMGVTTVITGNCGISHKNLAAALNALDARGGQVNVATLVGHNTVREAVMGASRTEEPGYDQLEAMRRMVDQAMRAGAVGFSTGLEYAPGVFSRKKEVVALAQVAARWNGVYATHLRNEGINLRESLDEAIETAQQANIHLHISHLKIACRRDWGKMPEVLAKLARARSFLPGLTQDVYAYNASSSSLDLMLPVEFRGSLGKARAILNDREQSQRLVRGMLAQMRADGFDDYHYAQIVWSRDKSLLGRAIDEIAELPSGAPAFDWVNPLVTDKQLRLQLRRVLYLFHSGGAHMIYHVMDEKDIAAALGDEYTVIGTDSAVRGQNNVYSHPRGYGNFPRVLAEYVRRANALTLAHALRKMTSQAADVFRLRGRGRIQEGYAADIVIFDPERVEDRATYQSPLEAPVGIDYVIVNGVIVSQTGTLYNRFPGRALRNSSESPPPLAPLSEMVMEIPQEAPELASSAVAVGRASRPKQKQRR